MAPAIYLDPDVAQRLARRLAPATRHLGIEKVVVRLSLLDRAAPERAPRSIEFVISDLTGSNMEIRQREPRTERLEPSSAYERKVVEARRRRLVYPYEIVRMLTGGPSGPGSGPAGALPAGVFEEYDLEPGAARPVARSVAGRAYGANTSAVVFGVIRTPTQKVPEGMTRVLVLSDPDARAWARSPRPSATAWWPRSTWRSACACRSSGCRSRAAPASRWTAAPRTSTPPRAWCGASSTSRRQGA